MSIGTPEPLRAAWPLRDWEIRALIEGRKTEKRVPCFRDADVGSRYAFRILLDNPPRAVFDRQRRKRGYLLMPSCGIRHFPTGQRLRVREAWAGREDVDPVAHPGKARHYCKYRATTAHPDSPHDEMDFHRWPDKWSSATQMPAWASRLTLEITGVAVQRVRDINESGALEEGITESEFYPRAEHDAAATYQIGGERLAYSRLWDSVYAKRGFGWTKNPWVFVYSFSVVTT